LAYFLLYLHIRTDQFALSNKLLAPRAKLYGILGLGVFSSLFIIIILFKQSKAF